MTQKKILFDIKKQTERNCVNDIKGIIIMVHINNSNICLTIHCIKYKVYITYILYNNLLIDYMEK